MTRLIWDAAQEDMPHHPGEPSIAAGEGYQGVALPEDVQSATILRPERAIKLGTQLIALGETVQQIEDNMRLATLDRVAKGLGGQRSS
jgi:hypothetical protein